jgi:8-oxo-dGTP diphosphatase
MEEEFAFPILTVDGVVFQLVGNELHVLLIERAFEPFLGAWALPGMYVSKDETTRMALERVLVEKTGVSTEQLALIEQPYAFDSPQRDPRGYAVTIMYIGLGQGIVPGTREDMTNGQNPTFHPLSNLPKLAYDHEVIVAFAHNRLKTLAAHTNVLAVMLPSSFTLLQLQTAYEAIFGKKLDKRNFRKRILSLNLIEPTGKMAKDGAHRPAQLYRFRDLKPHTPQSFD